MAGDEQHAGKPKLLGGCLCLDFANTVDWRTADNPQERLNGYDDLVAWSRRAGLTPKQTALLLIEEAARRPAAASAVHKKAIDLRESIFRIFSSIAAGRKPDPADITTLNGVLSEAMSRLQVSSSAGGFTWTWKGAEASLDQMIWPIVRSAAELLTSSELKRLGLCAGEGCGWLFFDTSKNRSRRWCAMEDCGNRAKARRHYKKSRGEK